MNASLSFCSLLFLAWAGVASAQATGPESYETTACENGKYGQLTTSEAAGSLVATATFVRVADSDSVIKARTLAADTCFMQPRNVTPIGIAPVQSPSTSTPIVNYLDAGEAIHLRGPNRELQLQRQINGPITSYVFQEFRIPTQAELMNRATNMGILSAGRIRISVPGGRDLGEYSDGFDCVGLRLTSPTQGSALSGASPPVIRWEELPSGVAYSLISSTFVIFRP